MRNRILRYVQAFDLLLDDDLAEVAPIDGSDARVPLELRIGRTVLEAVLLDNIAALRHRLHRADLPTEERQELVRSLKAQVAFLVTVRRDPRLNLSIGLYCLPQ